VTSSDVLPAGLGHWLPVGCALALAGGLNVSACAGSATAQAPLEREAGSASGCRAPSEPGCAVCCESRQGPAPSDRLCERRSGAPRSELTGANTGTGALPPGYTASETRQGPCPNTCAPCAPRTADQRASYQTLLDQGCDCTAPEVRAASEGIDPCWSPGCGCTCSQLRALGQCRGH